MWWRSIQAHMKMDGWSRWSLVIHQSWNPWWVQRNIRNSVRKKMLPIRIFHMFFVYAFLEPTYLELLKVNIFRTAGSNYVKTAIFSFFIVLQPFCISASSCNLEPFLLSISPHLLFFIQLISKFFRNLWQVLVG